MGRVGFEVFGFRVWGLGLFKGSGLQGLGTQPFGPEAPPGSTENQASCDQGSDVHVIPELGFAHPPCGPIWSFVPHLRCGVVRFYPRPALECPTPETP